MVRVVPLITETVFSRVLATYILFVSSSTARDTGNLPTVMCALLFYTDLPL
jgi:hypothetical protein